MVNWGTVKCHRPSDFHTPSYRPRPPLKNPINLPPGTGSHTVAPRTDKLSPQAGRGMMSPLKPSPQRGAGLGTWPEKVWQGREPSPVPLTSSLAPEPAAVGGRGRCRQSPDGACSSLLCSLRCFIPGGAAPPRGRPRGCGAEHPEVGVRMPVLVSLSLSSPRQPGAARALAPSEPTHGKLSPLATPRRDPRSRPA